MWMARMRLFRRSGRPVKLAAAMTNVVQLRPGVGSGDQSVTMTAARDATALVGLLAGMIERIESAGAQIAVLDRPPFQIERTIQALLDATTALEQAADALLDGDEDR
jgi:hypothetical protein